MPKPPQPASQLDTIAKLPPEARLTALDEYMTRGEERLQQARDLRDEAIRKLRAGGMPRKRVAELAKVSVAHVAAKTAKPRS